MGEAPREANFRTPKSTTPLGPPQGQESHTSYWEEAAGMDVLLLLSSQEWFSTCGPRHQISMAS